MRNSKSRSITVAVFLLIAGSLQLFAQAAPPQWTATWITHPTAPLREPIVLYFRKSVLLHSDRTAFLLEGDGDASIASKDKGWQVEIENGRQTILRQHDDYRRYLAIGPGEQVNAAQYDWDWKSATATSNCVDATSPMGEDAYSSPARASNARTKQISASD